MGVIFEALAKALVTILIVGIFKILYYCGLNKSDKKIKK